MNNVSFNPKNFNGPVLVTGAGGCIGSWVVALLFKAKIPLVAFDLSQETHRLKLLLSDSEINKIKWITGDIVDTKNIDNVIRDNNIQSIIHLAALQVPFCAADPVNGAKVNVVGTVNIFEAARQYGLRRLTYTSSVAAHGFLSKDREVFKELVSGKTKLLLGPKYVLLRPEYSLNRSNFSKKHNVKNVVVFYGNSDLTNETLKSLEAISRLNFDDLYINVVIGSNNPFFDIIQQKVKEIRNCHLHVQLPHLANLFSQANLALCAGGGALWELMCMGIPSLVTITSENQSAAAKILSSKEAVYCLGESREVSINDLELNIRNMLYDEKKLSKISHKAKKLVNGNGAKEVIREMKHLSM